MGIILKPETNEDYSGKLLICKAGFGTFLPGDLLAPLKKAGARYHYVSQGQGYVIDNYAVNTWFAVLEPNQNLRGKKFCLTGELDYVRTFYQKLIEYFGGKYSSSVTLDTQYLVTDTKTKTGKMKKALEQGIAIISSREFLKMLEY